MTPSARTLEHVGEWKVALTADTLEGLFVQVARAIARTTKPAKGQPGPWEAVSLTAPDMATLLADWANELIGRSEVARRAYADVRNVQVTEQSGGPVTISAEVRGKQVPEWTSPLKAATYHGLTLERHEGRWQATVLFDV